jgi:hypothetical protein
MGRAQSVLVAATLLVVACKDSAPPQPAPAPPASAAAAPTAAEATAPAPTEPAPAEPAAAPGPRPVADGGSQLQLRSGQASPRTLAPQTLKATRQHTKAGHTWLALPMPVREGAADAQNLEVSPVRFRAQGGLVATAARVPGPTRSKDEVVVRIVGPAPEGPLRFVVEYDNRGWSNPFAPADLQELTVEVPAGLAQDSGLPKAFFRGLARDLRALGEHRFQQLHPFYAFAAARAERLGGGATADGFTQPRRADKTDLADTMSLYTGMTSVQEALQADRGLMVRSGLGDASADTVSLDGIAGVPLPTHPWDEMLRTAQKTPVVEDMARHIPNDMLYVHLGDLRTAIRMANDSDAWLESLLQAVEARPASSHLVARYERELMLERMGLAETLGPLAVDGLALTVGDPFVRDGTDVSLVIRVKSRETLLAALAAYEAKARMATPGLSETEWRAGEHVVRLVSSPDGRVRQHRMELGDLLVISNSRAAIERFAAVADEKAPPLSESGDFRWMRAEYPYDPAAEDAFVFIGDAFVNRAVSPRTKILQGRRMAAQADLMSVGFAQLLHGMLEGKPAESADALVASGLLDAAELQHADGAPISFDPRAGARSDRWGRVDALTPLADLPLSAVSPSEQAAYERFRETYQAYWRGYIDPIAVRLRRTPDGKSLSADARMLPLVSGTDYDDLIGKVGATAIAPPAKVSGLRWTLAIGQDAPLRRELGGIGKSMNLGGLEWLGDYVMVGAASRSGIWDVALADSGARVPQLPREDDEDPTARRAQDAKTIARLPVYVGAHIANPVAFAGALAGLRTLAETTSPGLLAWGMADPYREVPIVTVASGKPETMPEFKDVRLYYATVGTVFVASLDLGTLQTVIDDVLDSPESPSTPGAGAEPARQADLRVSVDPSAPWLAKAAALVAEAELRKASWRAYRDIEVLAQGLGGLPPEGEARREAALGFFGYEPLAGDGATFSVDGDGRVAHSVYGTEAAPIFPALPSPTSPIARLADELAHASFGLVFEGKDDTRGLRAMVRWERR